MGAKIVGRRNPRADDIPFGEWVPTHAVRFNRDGTVELMAEPEQNFGRRRNVAAGFYDEDGYFHPIRASYDYSRARAGEPPLKRKKKARPKRRRK